MGLLNIGKEEEKGNLLTRATYQAMKRTKDFNFIGNVEGNDFFRDNGVDVMVCDGFVGNVLVKEMEAFYALLKRRNITDEFTERFNFETLWRYSDPGNTFTGPYRTWDFQREGH